MRYRRLPSPLIIVTLVVALLPLSGRGGSAPGAPHPFNVRDLLAMQRISDPQVSPDGKSIVFVLRTTDIEANKGRTDLWLVETNGSGLRQMTASPENESNPRWAPDGKSIYFLSSRGDSQQVWRLRMDGGEAERVTSLPLDVGSFAVARDGSKLVVSADVFPVCSGTTEGVLACTQKRLDEKAKIKSTGRLYSRLFVRHWDEWVDGRRSHLFVVPLAGGAPIDLMRSMDADCPSKPFGGVEDYAISPDGQQIVFSAKDVGREESWSTNFDLFAVPADGSQAPRNLTAANLAWDTGPTFSPDGKTLVYRAMSVPGYEADRFRIMLRSWPDGAERELAKEWDRSPTELVWSPDSKTLYATADSLGNHSLFAIDVASGRVRDLVTQGNTAGPAPAGAVLVFQRDDFRSPAELFTVRPDGSAVTQITRINAARIDEVTLGEAEQFTFPGWNGETVHGWAFKPANFDPAVKYPVAFLIHGGPQGAWNSDFHYRWNPQTYAAAGYAVVMINFHGSTGFGQKFCDSIKEDWGGKPLEDLKKGLDAALARYGFMDGNRVAALGASFGGYMINWIAGAWPDRFRCLVSHDGNLDESTAYYDTEELWFPERDHGGTPWTNPDAYKKHNPVDLVKNWKAPILVIHGGKDYRVVDTQGISTFTAAQRRGIPSQLLYFPDENHWVLKPQNSIQWHETVLAWLDKWTKQGPIARRE